jgi:uncharacterized Zn finger protein
MDAPARASVPALLVNKGGDYPSFWHKDGSFIEAMEEIYERAHQACTREVGAWQTIALGTRRSASGSRKSSQGT